MNFICPICNLGSVIISYAIKRCHKCNSEFYYDPYYNLFNNYNNDSFYNAHTGIVRFNIKNILKLKKLLNLKLFL